MLLKTAKAGGNELISSTEKSPLNAAIWRKILRVWDCGKQFPRKTNFVRFSIRPFLIDNKLRWIWYGGKVSHDKIIINSSLDRNPTTLSKSSSTMVGMALEVETRRGNMKYKQQNTLSSQISWPLLAKLCPDSLSKHHPHAWVIC